ncbi:HNH endonuclease [Streptomyces harbinensis]|uniref:HNH endonuclease n=1 Tax=Streptomyces harbinensis TaxID=1176198 RepID=UPI001FE3F72A|nr:HNH endonuclease signature motif containing protein [Streptomyces harbinensis]
MTANLTDPTAVLLAVKDYDDRGRRDFLAAHGFRPAERYYAQIDGRLYDAKAITNVALRHQHGESVDVVSGGVEHSNRMLERLGFTIVDGKPTTVEGERQWRLAVWSHLSLSFDVSAISPATLREYGAYGGGQGVWVDKARTRVIHDDGVTVGVLHTGRHYPDDLSEHDIWYHYPKTGRGQGRDAAEISATRAAAELKLPVFVIARPTPSSSVRTVRLAWVEGWEDQAEVFLMVFGDEPPVTVLDKDASEEAPFQLTGNRSRKAMRDVRQRPGQRRFKLQVFQRYGPRCPLSGIDVPEMIEAAHLRPDAEDGTDDPRNGLPMNAALHRAYDAYLFTIHPESLAVIPRPQGPSLVEMGIRVTDLSGLSKIPHRDALSWRYEVWQQRTGVMRDS